MTKSFHKGLSAFQVILDALPAYLNDIEAANVRARDLDVVIEEIVFELEHSDDETFPRP